MTADALSPATVHVDHRAEKDMPAQDDRCPDCGYEDCLCVALHRDPPMTHREFLDRLNTDLEELERTDPAVEAAADKLDRVIQEVGNREGDD